MSSKKRKNKSRSKARKLPTQPASRSKIQATNDLSPERSPDAASAIGNKSAVIRTKKSDIPSIPRLHEIPKAEIQA